MENIFLTGGRGFIGRHFVEMCGGQYVISAPYRSQLELSDSVGVDEYFSDKQFDCIVHAANVGGARNSVGKESEYFYENMRSFNNVFKRGLNVERFIQLGSGAEYGRPFQHAKVSEEQLGLVTPSDAYGLSKFLCTKMLHSLPAGKAVSLHVFGLFGAYEDYHMRFISNAIVRVLSNKPIVVNTNAFFDYVYIKDFIKILQTFIEVPADYHHYNIGSGERILLSDIAEIVRSVLKSTVSIVVKDNKNTLEYSCSNDRLKDFLGKDFEFTSLERSILELSKWYEHEFESLDKSELLMGG